MPDEPIVETPEDKTDLNPGYSGVEISDKDLDFMLGEGEVEDEKDDDDRPRDENGKFKKADDAKADDEAGDDPEIDIPGVGKLKASDIKKMRDLQARSEEIEARASELESQMEEAETVSEKLEAWKKLDALAERYPKIRERFNDVLKEVVESGDFGEEDSSPSRTGIDTSRFKGKPEELDPEEVADREFIRQMRHEKIGNDIKNTLLSIHEEYPDFIKVTTDESGKVLGVDKTWMKEVLAPEVEKRFGREVNMDHIRMTLNDMIVTSGAIKRARENGRKEVAEALARHPKGSVVLPPGGSKKQTVRPERDWKGEDWNTIAKSIADDDSIYQKPRR